MDPARVTTDAVSVISPSGSPRGVARGPIVLLCWALVVALASCASPQPEPMPASRRSIDVSYLELDGWHEVRSPRFILYSNSTTEDLEAFSVDLARFIAVVERLVNAEPPKTPARIFLVDKNVENLFVQSNQMAAYAHPSFAGFDLLVRGTAHDPVQRGIFLHEFTHYLTLRSRNYLYPAWYEEGFAEFLSTIRKRGNTVEIGSAPPWRLKELGMLQKAARIRARYAFDLKPTLAWTRSSGEGYPLEFYATSWITVHYLNSDPARHEQLATMLRLQGSGVDWREAFDRAFPETIDELERKIDRHGEQLVNGTPGAVLYLPLESLAVHRDWEIRDLSRSEASRIMAEFALRDAAIRATGYSMRIAEALFEQTLIDDPSDSLALTGLALALTRQKRFDDARVQLKAFEAVSDAPAEAFVRAGSAVEEYASSLEGDDRADEKQTLYEEAIALFERALVQDPAHHVALVGLGRSQLATGSIDAARTSLARAQERGEWDAEVTLDRARVEQKAGSIERARFYCQEALRLGGEQYAEDVNTLLEELDQAEKDAGKKPQKGPAPAP